ncbi:MAG: hypothetical protein ACTSRK_14425 [Promethearchaeota archaeon]
MTNIKPQNYLDELWDYVPFAAFIALGRRGREQINLHQCFAPNCHENDESKLHIVKEEKEEPIDSNTNEKVERLRYHIHCDTCQQKFQLVFERFLENDPNTEDIQGENDKKSEDEEEDEDKLIVFENVYATDETGKANYGQIGFVQPR